MWCVPDGRHHAAAANRHPIHLPIYAAGYPETVHGLNSVRSSADIYNSDP
ncbi:hypothetical protein EVA_12587 [gut metagenome]|uniref:Uncharacterized protein n=1 Tax=gut metagenome TaxID=749906 RepID=J9CGY2_9ZZZZ